MFISSFAVKHQIVDDLLAMALVNELETQGNKLFKYRGLIPIVFIIAGLVAFVLGSMERISDNDAPISAWYWYVCLAISLFGLFIRIHAVGCADRNTSGRNTKGQVADSVNKTGMYSILRHPLYVGNFFMWFGIALLTFNFWFIFWFIFLYVVYYERIIYAEEQFLIRKFGDEYSNWAEKTSVIFPKFSNWQKPRNPLFMKRILKQEITGLLLLAFIFLFFNELSEFLRSKVILLDMDLWMILFIVSLTAYIIIKIIQKTTGILKT